MSVFVYFSMYYLSFFPLWLTILFIDIKSLIDGGADKWTEIIGLAGIIIVFFISALILFMKFYVSDDEKYTFTIQDAKESKTITADFLLTYILPLIAFDFRQWDEVVKFLIFFFTLGYLCIRHSYLSTNILLEFMNYRMYDCKLLNGDYKEVKRIIISKNILTIKKGEYVQVKILNNEYFLDLYDKARKIKPYKFFQR